MIIIISGELAKTKAARDDLEEKLGAHVQSARRASSMAEETVAAAKKNEETAVQELNQLKLEHASACASLREQAVQLQRSLQVRTLTKPNETSNH